jgi:hypothetical protein
MDRRTLLCAMATLAAASPASRISTASSCRFNAMEDPYEYE